MRNVKSNCVVLSGCLLFMVVVLIGRQNLGDSKYFHEDEKIFMVNNKGESERIVPTSIKEETYSLNESVMNCSNNEAISVRMVTTRLQSEPCYVSSKADKCKTVYKINQSNSQEKKYITPYELENNTVMVFIHLNKAGGTTIKKQVLERYLIDYHADGAGLGIVRNWRHVTPSLFKTESASPSSISQQPWRAHNVSKRNNPEQYDFFQCGLPLSPVAANSKFVEKCALRVIWGSNSLGFCDYIQSRPCFYFILLRNPIDRAISDYNYFCVLGAENKKKWRKEWKEQGKCPLNITDYFKFEVSSSNLLAERLSKTNQVDSCVVDAALQNLQHDCMYYLLLERLAHGLKSMNKLFGNVFLGPYLEALAKSNKKENVEGALHGRTKLQVENAQVMDELKALLKNDLLIYNVAVKNYENQWNDNRIVSCTTNE